MANAQLLGAPRDGGGLAAGNDGDSDARGRDLLDAMAVTHVECLQQFAFRAVEKPAVGQHAVDVEHQQAHTRECRRDSSQPAHKTPARNRSCTLSAPTSVPCASTTGSAVMRCFSMRWAASAASSVAATRLPGEVMTSRISVLW